MHSSNTPAAIPSSLAFRAFEDSMALDIWLGKMDVEMKHEENTIS